MADDTQLNQNVLRGVKTALKDAEDNDHDFAEYSDYDVAGDMIAYCDTFEDWDQNQLARYVKEARKL